jgi:hypothetical protein
MTLNRWKILACTLTVGVGGLAVFATPPSGDKKDEAKEPAPLPAVTVKPTSPPNGADTPEPVKPAKAESVEFSFELPDVPAAPPKPDEKAKKPSTEPVFEPVAPLPATPPAPLPLILPAKAEADSGKAEDTKEPPVVTPPVSKPEQDKILPPIPTGPDTKSPPIPKLPDAPKPSNVVGGQTTIPTPDLDIPIRAPEKRIADVSPPAPPVKGEPLPMVGAPPPAATAPPATKVPEPPIGLTPPPTKAPLVDVPLPVPHGIPQPDPLVTPNSPAPARPPLATKPSDGSRLKMLLRMGDGQPRFEIRNSASTELLLKVYGEKIEMQSPPETKSSLVGVSAVGRVKFTAPGIEGTCDHLTILSATGEVLMKGNIHLKTKKGKAWSEMTAEKMVYQIGSNGLSSGETRPAVRPASYIPD